MKFIDWYNFNFEKNKIMMHGDFYVKLFRKESFCNDDLVFCTLMKVDDAVVFFGDYELFCVRNHEQNEYKTLSVFICK